MVQSSDLNTICYIKIKWSREWSHTSSMCAKIRVSLLIASQPTRPCLCEWALHVSSDESSWLCMLFPPCPSHVCCQYPSQVTNIPVLQVNSTLKYVSENTEVRNWQSHNLDLYSSALPNLTVWNEFQDQCVLMPLFFPTLLTKQGIFWPDMVAL